MRMQDSRFARWDGKWHRDDYGVRAAHPQMGKAIQIERDRVMHNAHVYEYYQWKLQMMIWCIPVIRKPIGVVDLNCMV